MSNSKKILIAALAVIFLAGATPIAAQIAGTWEGTGRGCCYPRLSTVIYPWQEWKGEIPNSQDVFTGEWWDADGNHGTFKGAVEFSVIPELAYAEGEWTWYDPTGPSHEPLYGGDFEMTFYILEGRCEGTWTSIWPSPSDHGTMRGRKID
ncbi:MAG: hypothetical protein E3J71_03055 [Candidatus Stahlbacteria bacterium]|nr:MAG: hypothetical protein E3J71_03055 [Candidatus Stahlbacteria bacterium]